MFFLYVIRGDESGQLSGPFTSHEAAQESAAKILSSNETASAVHILDRAQFNKLYATDQPLDLRETDAIEVQAYTLANRLGWAL